MSDIKKDELEYFSNLYVTTKRQAANCPAIIKQTLDDEPCKFGQITACTLGITFPVHLAPAVHLPTYGHSSLTPVRSSITSKTIKTNDATAWGVHRGKIDTTPDHQICMKLVYPWLLTQNGVMFAHHKKVDTFSRTDGTHCDEMVFLRFLKVESVRRASQQQPHSWTTRVGTNGLRWLNPPGM